ncbi:MAG: hypothetical protein CMG00_09400 [Candidatus Marinimicrobia bacterium]|nr:hypothetical protein [Candidatus Neomarinimicrobiota bacterium]|tara:strand:+ start:1363 stop:2433 length:1071 start_codon:yes stop_codon:yes gene_type:complete
MTKERISKVKDTFNKINIDGLYVTNITNVRYLTGFTGSAGSLLIVGEKNHFFTDGRYTEQVKKQVKNCVIHIVSGSHIKGIKDNNLLSKGLRIGFESHHVSYANYSALKESISNIGWVQTSGIIEEIAAVKDKGEIDHLKKAIEITDVVFDEIIKEIKEGVSENKIAALISYKFKQHGAEGDSYDPIVASGWRSALPHARPTDKVLEKGDFVVMDFGALFEGYHADMTRTILIGSPTEKHKEIYKTVLDSHLNGIKKAKAGVSGAEVDEACRSVIDSAGYGNYFNHSTGHGIGLEVHTHPRLSSINKEPLLENYVVTIEPGIYIPDWGGVRIEDDCWIKKELCVPLNKSTKELISL